MSKTVSAPISELQNFPGEAFPQTLLGNVCQHRSVIFSGSNTACTKRCIYVYLHIAWRNTYLRGVSGEERRPDKAGVGGEPIHPRI